MLTKTFPAQIPQVDQKIRVKVRATNQTFEVVVSDRTEDATTHDIFYVYKNGAKTPFLSFVVGQGWFLLPQTACTVEIL